MKYEATVEEKTMSWRLTGVGLLVEMKQAEVATLAGLAGGRREIKRGDSRGREVSAGTDNGSSWSTIRILARVMVLQ